MNWPLRLFMSCRAAPPNVAENCIGINPERLRALARFEGVAQAVAKEIQGKQGDHEHARGKNDEPPVDAHRIELRSAFRDERAPTRHGRLDAQAKVAQERFVEDD